MKTFSFCYLDGRRIILSRNYTQAGYFLIGEPVRQAQHIQTHRIGFGKSAGMAFTFGACIKYTVPVKEKGFYPGNLGHKPGIGGKKYTSIVFKYLLYMHICQLIAFSFTRSWISIIPIGALLC